MQNRLVAKLIWMKTPVDDDDDEEEEEEDDDDDDDDL